jgi:hypothetical protein
VCCFGAQSIGIYALILFFSFAGFRVAGKGVSRMKATTNVLLKSRFTGKGQGGEELGEAFSFLFDTKILAYSSFPTNYLQLMQYIKRSLIVKEEPFGTCCLCRPPSSLPFYIIHTVHYMPMVSIRVIRPTSVLSSSLPPYLFACDFHVCYS